MLMTNVMDQLYKVYKINSTNSGLGGGDKGAY